MIQVYKKIILQKDIKAIKTEARSGEILNLNNYVITYLEQEHI